MNGEHPPDHLFQRDAAYQFPLLERGEGIYVYDAAGKRYIDGAAGGGNVTLGHGRDRIAQVMAEQAGCLAYCFSSHFGTQSALDLADRIAARPGASTISTSFPVDRRGSRWPSRWRGSTMSTVESLRSS